MRKIFVLICMIDLISCKNQPKNFLDIFTEKVSTSLSLVEAIPSDSLGNPETILAIEDYLLFLEPMNPKLLTCFNLEKDSFYYILSKGQSNDEAVNIQTIGMGANERELYACDVSSQSVFLLSLDSIGKIRKIKTNFSKRFCEVAFDDDITFFLTVGSTNRFSIKYKDSIQEFGTFTNIEGVSPEIVSQTLQGPCVISRTQKRIAWFSVYGDVMEIYDYTDMDNITCKNAHVCCLPIFDKAAGYNNAALDPQTKLSVSSVTSDERNIYALYNEKSLNTALQNKGNAFFANKILVFDWNGKPVSIINLDRPVRSITYDKKRNQIIGLGLNDNLDYAVYEFSLREIK